MIRSFLLTVIGSFVLMTANAEAAEPANTLVLELSTGGNVEIEMLPNRAPGHVERIKKLTRDGFYDGLVFHRVIDGFMAQTGDPTGTGRGGSDEADLTAEFTDYEYKRGTVGMARTAAPNTANLQFFICFTDDGCSFLTGQYTVWGQVTTGMEHVDAIAKGEPPASPDKIVKAYIAADAANDAEPAAGEEPAAEEASDEAAAE